MKIGIKLGSALLADSKGKIREELIAEVCRQVAQLVRKGHEVFIVTSGAVASDRKSKRSKNLRAGVGQPRIISRYIKYLEVYGIEVAQFLLTDQELTGTGSKTTKATLFEAFKEKVVPVINANDPTNSVELKRLEVCADNDMLFKLVCQLVKADMVIIGFSEKGILDDSKKVLHEVRISELEKILKYAKGGNKLGHGNEGMATKIKVLGFLAEAGIKAILVPGKEKNFILRTVAGEKNFGTKFTA
jgi:glutamate 5-kinase